MTCLTALLFCSCDKPAQEVKQKNLPSTSQEILDNYFLDYEILSIIRDDDEYEIIFTNGYKIEFNLNGDWEEIDCGMDPVPTDLIPEPILTFVTTNFPENYIVQISRDYDGYEVDLNNGYSIEFDRNGNWVEIDCERDPVPTALIPEPILAYVSANYPQNFIVQISKDNRGYDVELNNDVDLEFDTNGNFLRIDD